MLDTALQYHKQGFHVIPVTKDKSPACANWKAYQDAQTEEDVRSLFAKPCYGIAVVMAKGYEALDFDSKNDEHGRDLYYEYGSLLRNEYPTIYSKLTTWSQRTPTNGAHILFRSNNPGPNQPLSRGANGKVLIETRGQGGYILVTPSPGYRSNKPLVELPYIDDEERELLITLGTLWNEAEDTVRVTAPSQDFPLQKQFNADHRSDWMLQTLQSEGWKVMRDNDRSALLRRPGKTEGSWSAELKKQHGSEGIPLLQVFSTDAYPLDQKCYDSYGLWATLTHGGDFTTAARAARQMYPLDEKVETIRNQQEPPAFVKEILANRWDYNAPPPDESPRIVYKHLPPRRGEIILAVDGSMCAIKGHKGSRKSFFLNQLEMSGLSGGNILGFAVNLCGKKILHIDTEMEQYFIDKRARRMINTVGAEVASNFIMHGVRKYGYQERKDFIDWVVHHEYKDAVGLIVIDGVVDLIRDFNDKGESTDLANWLMYIGEITGAPTLNIIHNNPNSDKARGHAGTEVENKSASLFNVETNFETSETTVKCKKARGGPHFPDQYFTQDEYGNLSILNQLTSTVSYQSKGKNF